MPPEISNIEIAERSEELSEIIGRVPNRVFSYTLYTVLILISICIVSAYFIKYPEKISGEITIYNTAQPLKIISEQNIQLSKLFVKDGENVKSGDVIALIANSTNFKSIEYLRKISRDYSYIFSNIDQIIINDNVALSFGDMQSEYNSLIENLLAYKQSLSPVNKIKLKNLYSIKNINDSLGKIYNSKSSDGLKEFVKESERFSDYEKLYKAGVISKHEYFNAIGNQFTAKSQIENNERDKVQQNLGSLQKQQDILEYTNNINSEKNLLYHKLYANIRNIEVFIKNWDQKYLIKAAKTGKVNFSPSISEGQYYKAGEELFVILMPNKGIFGIANISSEGAGNIETKQRTRIKLKKYPFNEYGFVNGRVKKISSIPYNNNYKVIITIDHIDNKELAAKLQNEEEANGEIDIITKNYSLLDKMFMNINKILQK